jgi:glucose-1-phosphate cytidylyltransferase
MKVVILCGGQGTRISEESHLKPKPMIEIGNKPILWHIMKIYSYYGFNEFIICLGYKGYVIKEYFAHYFLHESDVTFDFERDSYETHYNTAEPWKVTLVDTGEATLTGARVKAIQKFTGNEPFMLTYGDGVADINIKDLSMFHMKPFNKTITVTASQPKGRFGALNIDNSLNVRGFIEKPEGDLGWINSGFMVCEPGLFDYISGNMMLEEAIAQAVKDNNVKAYKHYGFFAPMDTIRDMNNLNELWKGGNAPWKVW